MRRDFEQSDQSVGGVDLDYEVEPTTINLSSIVGDSPPSSGSLTFKEFEPDKAVAMAEELRLSGIKTMGVDWIKEAEMEPPKADGETNLSERREFLTHLKLVLAARTQISTEALNEKIRMNPNNNGLKSLKKELGEQKTGFERTDSDHFDYRAVDVLPQRNSKH